MELTKDEEKSLNGEHGEALQTAYRILSATGEATDAEKLVPIHWAHVSGVNYNTIGDAGEEFLATEGDYETTERKARQQELEEYEEKYLARQGQRPTRKPAEKKETPMFCNNCGAAFKKSEAKFCGECGTPRS